MNFSISAVIKWFHDAIFGHEERIAALEQAVNVKPATTTPPPPPEVVAHVQAAPSVSEGIVGNNGLKVLWKDYAGQSDRQALPAITVRIGRGLTDAEVQAAYAAGIVRSTPAPQPEGSGDPHAGFDFGSVPSGNYKRNTLEGGTTYPFTFKATGGHMRLIVAPENTMGKGNFDRITVVVRQGSTVLQSIDHPANTGANYLPLNDLNPGDYQLDVTLDKTDLVAIQFGS